MQKIMTAKPKDTTAAQRKAAERKRLRERGLVPVEVWVLPEHKDALRRFVAGLLAHRKDDA